MSIWDWKLNETIILYAVLIVVFLWIWSTEADGNKCHDVRRRDCSSDKYRIDPQPGDTDADLLQRLEGHARLYNEKVIWRRSILYSIIIALVLWIVIGKRLPDAYQLIVTVAVLYIFIYIMNQYYIMHFDQRVGDKVIKTINKLRANRGLATPFTASDLNGI